MTLRGNDALQFMQTPSRLLFDGRSERTKLYPGISNLFFQGTTVTGSS